jgi:hypothetical protein
VTPAEPLRGERRDDLVGVHVRGRAGAGLEHVDRELGVPVAAGHVEGDGRDRGRLVRVEQPALGPYARPEALDQREPADQLPLDRPAGDREVFHRALGLRPPLGLGGHPHLAHRIVLDPEVLCLLAAARPGLAHTGSFDAVQK